MPISLKTGRALATAAALLLLAACGSTPTGAENLPIYPTVQSGQALLPDWEHIPQNEVLPEENEEPAENDGQSGEKQPERRTPRPKVRPMINPGIKPILKQKILPGRPGTAKTMPPAMTTGMTPPAAIPIIPMVRAMPGILGAPAIPAP